MSNDAIAEPSPESSLPESRKGRRTGVVLCAVSAVVMVVAVILITGRLFFLGSENLRATDAEKLQEMAPAAGAESKN
jgi:Mn2+/Fe2+ NRAMP family transporter